MKVPSLTGLAILGAVAPALAFPTELLKGRDLGLEELAKIAELASRISANHKEKRQIGLDIVPPAFNANAQRVDTTGKHEFRPPGKGATRGSCPGLNTLANHGYISRDGVASVSEIIDGSVRVFGMGVDLATFLTVYSAVMAGDLVSVSIGAKPGAKGLIGGIVQGLGSGLGLIGEPQGLDNSHNRFEADVSPTRGDLYKTGDAVNVNIDQFQQLWDMPQGPNGYDLTVMHPFRGKRFENSIHTNPYFFNGPFGALAIQTATYLFTYHFFGNCSEEHPKGYLDGETLKSFESVVGESGSFKHIPGHERIPENWYRRAIGDEYGIPAFTAGAVDALRHLPNLLVLGGNAGRVDTFTGVDVSDLTGGVLNAAHLLEGNNALCLAFQAVSTAAPDLLRGVVGNLARALALLDGPLAQVLASLGCPQLARYDSALFKQFPGSKGGF